MKLKLIFTVLLIISQGSWSQNCDFEISILSNELHGEAILIDQSEYETIHTEPFIEIREHSEQDLTKEYPEMFKVQDSCLIYGPTAYTEKTLCKNRVQTKAYSDYNVKGVYYENALIETIGYEHWGFISVDLKTGLTFYTLGKPLTSNGNTAISYANYYGEEEIALTHLKTKKQYVIRIEGWRTIASKALKTHYYLKLESEFNCKKEIRYLKVIN